MCILILINSGKAEKSLTNSTTVIILLMCCVITKSKTNTDEYNAILLRLCIYLRKIMAVENSISHNISTVEHKNMVVCDRKHTIM